MKRNLLSSICLGIFSCTLVTYFLKRYWTKQLCTLRQTEDKLQDHYWLLNHWLELKNEGKSVANYFKDMGYQHIAIYGMSDLANRLMEDLSGSSICVDYGIDQDICCSITRIDNVYFPEDDLPETDVIVVTPYSALESIKSVLEKKVSCPIISLEDVVWSV